MAQNPHHLEVYQEALDLANDCLTAIKDVKGFYRLKEQIFGSTTSVPANLAEFCALESKGSQREKLTRCIAECNETDVWLEISHRQDLLSSETYKGLANRNKVLRMKIMRLKEVVESSTV